MLYSKGADDVMFARLKPLSHHDAGTMQQQQQDQKQQQSVIDSTSSLLTSLASRGLRTLVFAYRNISQSEYDLWLEQYTRAKQEMSNRQSQVEATYDLIEKNLELIGASAIEDCLQEGVAHTIEV